MKIVIDLQEVWRHERNDYQSVEFLEALDRVIRALEKEEHNDGVGNGTQH